MLLYLGPETAMPLATALAAISAGLILFWRKVVNGAKAMGRLVGRLFGRQS